MSFFAFSLYLDRVDRNTTQALLLGLPRLSQCTQVHGPHNLEPPPPKQPWHGHLSFIHPIKAAWAPCTSGPPAQLAHTCSNSSHLTKAVLTQCAPGSPLCPSWTAPALAPVCLPKLLNTHTVYTEDQLTQGHVFKTDAGSSLT